MRVFVALELPSAIKAAAVAIQRELMKSESSVGWVRAEGMHLTLKFFGEVSPSRLPEIEKALGSAAEGTGSVKITVRGIGVFPNPKNPRVVWLGILPEDDRLKRLQERIDRALAPLGFPPENREFRPHLTLGRVKASPIFMGARIWPRRWPSRGLDDLMKVVAVHQNVLAGDCVLDHLHLIQSELKPGGAVYTKIRSFAL